MYYNKSTCCHSAEESFIFEPFQSITLELLDTKDNSPQSLFDILANHFKEEELSKENSVYGDNHKNKEYKMPSKRKLELWWVPSVITLVIKRFGLRKLSRGNQNIMLPSKNGASLVYPENLDLNNFIKLPTTNDRFKLRAVCHHHGSTLSSGHYTAKVRRNNPNRWYNISDSNVSKSDCPANKEDKLAYILFYQKEE